MQGWKIYGIKIQFWNPWEEVGLHELANGDDATQKWNRSLDLDLANKQNTFL